MGVVLLILKILGITILCILGLVLLILALVLFVPIRYRADGKLESKEKHDAVVCVHWLLHAIDVRIIDDSGTISKRIRILGLFGKKKDSVIFPSEKKDDDGDDESEENDTAKPDADSADGKPEGGNAETAGAAEDKPSEEKTEGGTGAAETSDNKPTDEKPSDSKPSGGKPSDEKPEADTSESDSDGTDDGESEEAESAEEKPKKRSIGERIEDLKETANCVLELFTRRKDLLKEYLTKKSTKAALGKLWKDVLWLLKTLAPRKGHAEVTFGLKDPELTGKAFAAASALYPWYGKHIDLYPEFGGEKIEGEGSLRGRIRLWGVAIRALGILFDKNIKKVRKEFEYVKDKMTSTPAELKKIIKKEDAA